MMGHNSPVINVTGYKLVDRCSIPVSAAALGFFFFNKTQNDCVAHRAFYPVIDTWGRALLEKLILG
jgi:hypothetical protein